MKNTWNDLEKARTAELKRKAISVTLVTIPTVILLELIFYRVNGHDPISWLSMLVVAGVSFCRFFHVRYSRQSAITWQRTTAVFATLSGTAWGLYFFRAATLASDNLSIQVMAFICGLGYSATSTYTLAIEKYGYRGYLTPLVALISAAWAMTTGAYPLDRIVGLVLFFILYLVALSQGNIVERSWVRAERYTLELQSLIDSFPGGILVTMNDATIRANAYFKALFGSVKVFDELMESPEFAERFRRFKQDESALRTDFEAIIPLSTGNRVYWFLLVKTEGSLQGVEEIIVVALDVQAKKDAEAQIESQRIKLQTSAKLAALGEMAGGVAHEINNPIFVISSRVQLMLLMLQKDSENERIWKPHFNAILETCDRIVKIVRGLKVVSRSAENEAFETASICGILEQTLDLCASRLARAGAKLELGTMPKDCDAEVRSVQISQVFLNLLNNAFDAIEGTESPWIRIEIKSEPGELVISITDSGNGIPAEIRSRVMDPFFTTKAPGKGTGLGLSISLGIMRVHHGELSLDESCPNTRFVLRLPKTQKFSPPQVSGNARA
ncbi:MAG: sensor histidine kinase [Bdellovibrionia bacterium]